MHRYQIILGLIFALCCVSLAVCQSHKTFTLVNSSTAIRIALPHNTAYRLFSLPNPERLVLDLNNTSLSRKSFYLKKISKPIKKVRIGFFKPHVLRLVFQLTEKQIYKSRLITTTKDQHLIITLKAKKTKAHPTPQSTVLQKNLEHYLVTTLAYQDKPSSDRLVTIVIDPGHGGKDPGTVGYYGTHEKDITRIIALRLQNKLNQYIGFHAILTHTRDCFIPLRGRLQIARHAHADLFLSIHADAYIKSNATGASIFALSTHGASSEAALWLSNRENHSELAGINLSHKNKTLYSVLLDLEQTASISASLKIGDQLLNNIKLIGSVHHDSVEQAPFMVLKNPDIPSLLIETGFLSNPSEERVLHNSFYQQRLVKALATGIVTYFSQHPPRNTLLARLHPNTVID